MKPFNWDSEKNKQLIESRDVSFEDVIFSLQSGGLLDDGPHPNLTKYPSQRLFIVQIEDYAYLVPYVESKEDIFFKTIIPSRKATQRFLGDNNE